METKEKYNWLRENERRKIISFMKEKGMKVSYQGGKGHFDYTNSGQLEKSYDLTNSKDFSSFREANPVAVTEIARLVVVIRRVCVPPQVGHLG